VEQWPISRVLRGESVDLELRGRRKDTGQEWFFSFTGEPVRDDRGKQILAVVVTRDITERKRAEAELVEAHGRTRRILEGMAEAFYSLDDQWRFVQVNPAAERAPFGRPESELLGRSIWDVFPAIVGTPIHQHYLDAVEKRSREHYEAQSPLNGRWYEVFMFPRTGGLDVYLRDITDRKTAEEALREANERLQEADRRKNEFLAVLSHELRNPLTPIRYSLHILERSVPGSEPAKRAQEVIGRQTGQLVRLVDDLLDVTRVSRNKIQLQRRQLDLNDLVRRTVEDHRSLLEEKGITVEAKLTPERLSINGDEARLAQVVGNLLQNAAKFTPTGGRVRVATAMVTSRSRAALRVADTGAGIEPAILRRLFQPFMQADMTLDRSRGGLGLGLALVKGLVEMHDGEVCAHSDGPGTGAEFVVELPLDLSGVAETGSAPAAARKGRRVLIIEDNIDAADSLRDVLKFQEHIVEVAYSGPEGLARARDFRPEVVLCDIGLPGMDGFEVARALRADESIKGVVLVALSGYALPEDLQRAAEAGFQRHLAKPPSPEKLAQVLADLAPPRS
jgi:two-component system CheB/CheR fusion protein